MKIVTADLEDELSLPWKEEVIFDSVIGEISEKVLEVKDLIEKIEDIYEPELADSMVDVDNARLLKWYMDDLRRLYYADEAIENGADEMGKILVAGQAEYYRENIVIVKDKILNYLMAVIKTELI